MNRLSNDTRAAILRCLLDGSSIRATCRIVGVAKGTILKLIPEIGTACREYQSKTLVNLPCRLIQCDEIWAFVGAKERNTNPAERGYGRRGDVWTWTAIDPESKLIPSWHVGTRDADAALVFMTDLASRLSGRVQLTTDGHSAYISAVGAAFHFDIDYAQLVKIYGKGTGAEFTRRYSPQQLVRIEKRDIIGKPDDRHTSTSLVERSNLSMRTNVRRFTRLTNAFSKKVENHAHSVSLHMMSHNFIRPHGTLTRNAGGIHTTPAMAASVTNRVWTVGNIVELL